jgi:poly(hydroxyalkanoate) depolymerase family esterase
MARGSLRAGRQALARAVRPALNDQRPPPGPGDWLAGLAVAPGGVLGYRLYRPPALQRGAKLPLLVMLHGCGQTARSFALSTRMNRIAAKAGFFVLYPEQDRLGNPQGCWNWFQTVNGRVDREVRLLMATIDQVSLLYPIDRDRVAVAGLSAGASMAALLVTHHPRRFKALAMHSGVAPGAARSGLSALGAMQGRGKPAPLAATPDTMADDWPALLVIQGGADAVVAASNGADAVQLWADAAGALAGPTQRVQRGKRYALLRTEYRRLDRTVATQVDIASLSHAWSGGAASQPFSDARGPDASRMIWSFAARQFAL